MKKALILASLIGLGALAHSALAQESTRSGDEKRAQSQALTSERSIGFTEPGRMYSDGESAQGASPSVAKRLPLPDGGNFNGIRWAAVDGTLSEADVYYVLEFNAGCQWLRAFRDDREKRVARDILQDVPEWRTFRGNDRGELARAAAEELTTGAAGDVARAFLADCDATHEREVRWAVEHGLAPST